MAFNKILIIGSEGMLGQELQADLRGKGYTVLAPAENELNLLHPVDEIQAKVEAYEPELVLHLAALTNVDAAERDPELAMAINKDGARKIAVACKELGLIMAYISTDQVFDGTAHRPYTPEDKPNPINQYGLSKYYGELVVSELLDTHYILRTSWLYGIARHNFVQWVLESARQGREITVVDNWFGTPTWAGSLAHAIERIATSGAFGTYHLADQGTVSKYQQAVAICKAAGLSAEGIRPINDTHLTFDAPRPHFTPLDCGEIAMPHWETSLQAYLTQYFEKAPVTYG